MRNGKDKKFVLEIDMVYWNLQYAYFLKVGQTRVPRDGETLVIVCYVGIHVGYHP